MTTTPKLFTEIHPIEASSLPRPETEEFKQHIDELIEAATEVIESTSKWKSRGIYHNIVEVRERTDWRGKRNWFLRRSVHKDIPLEAFKVNASNLLEINFQKALRENHSLNEMEYLEAIKETKLVETIEPGVLESTSLIEKKLF
jgi:hypothetical protein